MNDIEPELAASLQGLLNADVSKLEKSFLDHMNEYESRVLAELQRESSTIASDEESKQDCVTAMCTMKMLNETGEQISKFRQGLYEILPAAMTNLLSADELSALLSGSGESVSDEVRAQIKD